MKWLVTGGAGYIGTHVVNSLLEADEEAVILDDLSSGTADRVPAGVPLVEGSVLNRTLLDGVFADHRPDGVIHIAAKKQVGESVERPLHYYRENVEGLRTLLDATVAAGVTRFLFSSSAAVYGMPDVDLVLEDAPKAPLSPYGESKLIGEWMIKATAKAHGLSYAALRYFNVAGSTAPEMADPGVYNLIPMVLEKITAGQPPKIFGDDYATADGTCVRDYIHVGDLAEAHVAAARKIAAAPGTGLVLNVGRGEGSSVREVVDLVLEVSGRTDLVPVIVPRRAGDPDRIVGSAERITAELGWKASRDLREMVESAWAGWQRQHGA
jgi:UDP-glucose 4-epimerase